MRRSTACSKLSLYLLHVVPDVVVGESRQNQRDSEHDVGDSRAAQLLSRGAPASLQRREPGLEQG